MEQAHGRRLLQCWLDLDSFQQHMQASSKTVTSLDEKNEAQCDWQQMQDDAMVLYDKCVTCLTPFSVYFQESFNER